MKISQELFKKIQKIIDEFVADPNSFLVGSENADEKLDLRKIAGKINVLPLVFD